GAGGFELIRGADRMAQPAYPAAAAKHGHDAKTYPHMPGPPEAGRFTTPGAYGAPGDGPIRKLCVVGHGARQPIQICANGTRPATPAATWIGCAIAPDPISLSSVRGLPDGGFITTNFLPRGTPMQSLMGGEQNGELWEWHTESGWQKVPGSE